MDWWVVPVGLGVAALLRYLWVAAFHPPETVSAMPELDGYVPAGPAHPGTRAAPEVTEPGTGSAAVDTPRDAGSAGGDGIWIELDIEPLFSSSDAPQIVDLTEAHDPEATP